MATRSPTCTATEIVAKAVAEFYAALRYDGILSLDQSNYDEMLGHGFMSNHKYYYCGDQVTAEPEYLDESLARFKYSSPDGWDSR